MNQRLVGWLTCLPLCALCAAAAQAEDGHQNFQVAVYCRAQEVDRMDDPDWLEPRWDEISRQLHVDKVYLESHRDTLLVDDDTLERAKKFFADRGIRTAGGITLTVAEGNRFQTFCYSRPDHREQIQKIVEHTARHFDEVILDDFFFTNCKCEACIAGKGDQSWTQYRLKLLADAARDLIIGPAKAVHPNVKMVVKYPNWYEHFQGLGYNLEAESKMFDGIYTGTETRDPFLTQQHLQQYQSYLIMRYFDNIKPGGNLGGWVDTGAMPYMDRYAEQLWLTLFAKAPEITLFDFRQMLRPIRAELRADWQGQGTSFDFDEMSRPIAQRDGTTVEPTTMAAVAGYSLDRVDGFLDQLGTPVGLPCYKPYHSTGEDFLHNYLGMCGIPIDLVPEFPADADTMLLAESAKFDPEIVEKIKRQLEAGKRVIITSGLLDALQDRGIEDIVELRYTDKKVASDEFLVGWGRVARGDAKIVLPQIKYLTNDSWEEISALAGPNGFPLLHSADYATGKLYVLVVPDNFADLYQLPAAVLTHFKRLLLGGLPARLEGPSRVAIFLYDNDTLIVESFHDEPVEVRVAADQRFDKLHDLVSGEALSAEEPPPQRRRFRPRADQAQEHVFTVQLKPHSFRAFRMQ